MARQEARLFLPWLESVVVLYIWGESIFAARRGPSQSSLVIPLWDPLLAMPPPPQLFLPLPLSRLTLSYILRPLPPPSRQLLARGFASGASDELKAKVAALIPKEQERVKVREEPFALAFGGTRASVIARAPGSHSIPHTQCGRGGARPGASGFFPGVLLSA